MPSSHQKLGWTILDSRMIRNSVGMPDHTSIKRCPTDRNARRNTLGCADAHADQAGKQRQRQAEQHRDAKTVQNTSEHVAAVAVGAEQVVARRRRGKGTSVAKLMVS